MKIAEIFHSRQGEGLLTGTQSVFVRQRLQSALLVLRYSVHFLGAEGVDLSVDEILARVGEFDTRHVVVTGGEPMLFAELVPLTAALAADGRHITIETAGTLDLPVTCDLMSISPKLSNSTPSRAEHPRWNARHEQTRHAPAVIRRLLGDYVYQLKFVVDTPEDCQEIEAYLAGLAAVNRSRVLLMPQGIDTTELAECAAWLVPYCESTGVRYCPRKHIEWYGMVRGT